MLMLTRKPGEYIIIGDGIKISIDEIRGKQVKLGIEAPRHMKIVRGELLEQKASGEKEFIGIPPYRDLE